MRPLQLEDLGVLALLAVMWIGVPAWLVYRLWWQSPRRRRRAESVEGRPARTQRERVEEIEAAWGRDYTGGRAGGSFFAPGGLAILGWMVFAFALSWWLGDLIRPIADWLVPAGRAPR